MYVYTYYIIMYTHAKLYIHIYKHSVSVENHNKLKSVLSSCVRKSVRETFLLIALANF